MLNQFEYPVDMKKDRAQRHLVTFPDLPEAATDGATIEEALQEAADCLGEALASRLVDGDPIPAPSSARRGQWVVAPDATLSLKIALNLALKDRGMTAADLARRLEVDHKEARRLLDPREPSKEPRLTDALAALDYGVGFTVYDRSQRERTLSSPLARRATTMTLGKTVRAKKRA